jgi:hypothetical protein
MKNKDIIFFCACSSPEHQLILRKIDGEPEVYVEIHLTHLRLLQRLWIAIRYVFGYKCTYGCFQEIILNNNTQEEMINFLETNDKV